MNTIKYIVGLLVVLFVTIAAQAQTAQLPLRFWLTNSTTPATGGPFYNGSPLTLSSNAASATCTSNIYSVAFPLYRGRGFMLNAGYYYPAGGTGTNATYTIQFGNLGKQGTTTVTNWMDNNQVSLTIPINGVAVWTNGCAIVLPTTIDNVAFGRLVSVKNATTNALTLDPTNTFISVIP